MGDSIFTKIRKKIGRLFGREETAAEQEIPEVQTLEEAPQTAAEIAGDLSLDDVPPAEPPESRYTEEYVQFLEETDGGLPQTDKVPDEAKGQESESADAPEGEEPEEPEDVWCEEAEEAADLWPEEAKDLQREEADDFWPEDPEEKKE